MSTSIATEAEPKEQAELATKDEADRTATNFMLVVIMCFVCMVFTGPSVVGSLLGGEIDTVTIAMLILSVLTVSIMVAAYISAVDVANLGGTVPRRLLKQSRALMSMAAPVLGFLIGAGTVMFLS